MQVGSNTTQPLISAGITNGLLRNYGIFTENKCIMVLVLKKGASKREIESIEKKLKNKSGIDVMKYCGKIKLKEDALVIQKSLRDEWQ